MPVLPDEITAQEFRRRWRGYDRGQVVGFLILAGMRTDTTRWRAEDGGGAADRAAPTMGAADDRQP